MKKLLLLSIMVLGFGLFAFSQVSKADVEKMMSEINTSADKIEKLYVYNTQVFYTDGTYTRSYSTYSESNGEYENSVMIYDSGIVLSTKKNGVEHSRNLYPFNSISYIEVGQSSIWIYLKQ
ncbi:MAG: hypothetical protein C0596_00880 [Marinilabiliales bacterium]|nr:MAG: hypothetical protein C0596_00880 [Marinilabiliales bacterium]